MEQQDTEKRGMRDLIARGGGRTLKELAADREARALRELMDQQP